MIIEFSDGHWHWANCRVGDIHKDNKRHGANRCALKTDEGNRAQDHA